MINVLIFVGGSSTIGEYLLSNLIKDSNLFIYNVFHNNQIQLDCSNIVNVKDVSELHEELVKTDHVKSVRGLILLSGIDCYIDYEDFDKDAFLKVLDVNFFYLAEITKYVEQQDLNNVCIFFTSSNTLDYFTKNSLVYSSSKIVTEFYIKYLVANSPKLFRYKIYRLPFIGHPMKNIIGEIKSDLLGSKFNSAAILDLLNDIRNHIRH